LGPIRYCQVQWSHRVTGISQDADGVRVQAQTPETKSSCASSHLVACDGVRSALREQVGVAWTASHADRFISPTSGPVAWPGAPFPLGPTFNPGRMVIRRSRTTPGVSTGSCRLTPTSRPALRCVRQAVRAVIGDIPYEIDCWAPRFHQRVVSVS
jgi:2-polyprenyl-6-methoxyphenol hydroxylase-like FAD-dependent oxidoreductase